MLGAPYNSEINDKRGERERECLLFRPSWSDWTDRKRAGLGAQLSQGFGSC